MKVLSNIYIYIYIEAFWEQYIKHDYFFKLTKYIKNDYNLISIVRGIK